MAVDVDTLLAARAMAIDLWTVEAVAALQDRGVRTVLLKGPAIAGWLYDEARRPYGDADLLVAPSTLPRAQAVLRAIGYELKDPAGERRLVSGPHAETWVRRTDGSLIDLHHTIPGGPYAGELVWRAMAARSEPLALPGGTVGVLAEPSRAVLLAVHAAHHGPGSGSPIEDLQRGVARLPLETWAEAVQIADLIGALPQVADALQLVPGGPELAERLRLPEGDELDVLHRRPIAAGLERLARAGGFRARLALMWRYAFPSRIYMRRWAGWTGASRLSLGAAYAVRLLRVLAGAVPAFRAWRRARAGVSSR